MKKYSKGNAVGMGWHKESQRHRLARLGVKTGKKVSYATTSPIRPMNNNINQNDVSYTPTSVSVTDIPNDDEIMNDVEGVVAEQNVQGEIEDVNTQLGLPEKILKSFKSTEVNSVEKDLTELESEAQPLIKNSWSDNAGNFVNDIFAKGVQAYKDLDINGISEHVSSLELKKEEIEERVNIIEDLKSKIKSPEYRKSSGITQQLEDLKRVNNLLKQPKTKLASAVNMINKLTQRKLRLEQGQALDASGKKPVNKDSLFYIMGHLDESIDDVNKKKKQL